MPSIQIFDDANSALAAELAYGSGILSPTVVMLTLGTGYGTSVSIDGQWVYKGMRGLVEGGHTIMNFNSNSNLNSYYNSLLYMFTIIVIVRVIV